ncbi:MAG: hypothetical protein KAT15_16710 [Bacteroidales bacterium]|nr:hypothetical protein [Bacteroidales bacterium]
MMVKFKKQIESDILKIILTTLILSVCFLGGCTRPYAETNLPYESEIEREEYYIYSLSIEHIYLRNLLSHNKREVKSIVIISETSELNEYWRDKLVGDIESVGMQEELLEDWRKENGSTSLLQRKFDLSYEYNLVSKAELERYEGVNFFSEFYRRYPDSNGLISVSRIGFDKSKNTALIHVVHSYGILGARFNFIVLKRTEGVWNIERRISTDGS